MNGSHRRTPPLPRVFGQFADILGFFRDRFTTFLQFGPKVSLRAAHSGIDRRRGLGHDDNDRSRWLRRLDDGAILDWLPPVLCLHVLLLPVNALRLREEICRAPIQRSRATIKVLGVLMAFMTKEMRLLRVLALLSNIVFIAY